MFRVIETHTDLSESLVKVVPEEMVAQTLCCNWMRANPHLLRVYYRSHRSTVEKLFYETESQVIFMALHELHTQKVYLDPDNLPVKVEELIVTYITQGFIPWADPDMAATAISKLTSTSTEDRQRILDEFHARPNAT